MHLINIIDQIHLLFNELKNTFFLQ